MQVTIIEPHEHFEMLLALWPAVRHSDWPTRILCSSQCRQNVIRVQPEMAEGVEWDCSHRPQASKDPSVQFFTSLQYHRKPWLPFIKQWPTALIIGNSNFYLGNPLNEWTPIENTRYSRLRFYLEKVFRFPINQRLSQNILNCVEVVIPYSPLQSAFIQKHHPGPTRELSFHHTQSPQQSRDYDFLPIYKKVHQLDLAYLQSVIPQFHKEVLCLCLSEEVSICRKILPERVQYIEGPISHIEYWRLFEQAGRVILPLQQQMTFGVVNEILGQTKYLARIYTALSFQKPLLMPGEIPQEKLPDSSQTLIEQYRAVVEYLADQL